MKQNLNKTNVMRMLEQKKIKYKSHFYKGTGTMSAIDVANVLEQNSNQIFKTLVTVGNTKENYVFLIPINKELDLKKGASAVGEKSIAMIKSKDLLLLTGYIHGCCSPIGMKKQFKTIIDLTAKDFETIIFSGGKIGYEVEISLDELKKVISFDLKDVSN